MNTHDAATPVASIERTGWSIDEWCARNGFKRGLYYKMDDKPETILIGRRRIVTVEGDREWRERQRAKAKAALHEQVA